MFLAAFIVHCHV